MALTPEQIEILADKYIVGLYQELEQNVIVDVARRVKKTGRYTETAELMARSLREQGFAPAKIRAEVMKSIRADKELQKAIAENTKAYKAYVKEQIDDTVEKAKKNGNNLVAEAGNMDFEADIKLWDKAGVELTKTSALNQLVKSYTAQTNGELKNITQSMGFKSTVDVDILNAYQHELDLAIVKTSSGAITYDTAVNDCVRGLAKSGLRTIDYASGRSYQLDTASRMSVRTGLSQLAGKITEMNCESTGQDLVITSQHIGSRPSHAVWQNQIFSLSGKSNKYPSLEEGTGYGTASGLKGTNCTHDFYPFWEGISVKEPDDVEPPPTTVNGKEYTYFEATQKQRAMERDIRALKRERNAQKEIGGDTKVLNAKIKAKKDEYASFSNKVGISQKPNRISVMKDEKIPIPAKKAPISKEKAIKKTDKLYSAKELDQMSLSQLRAKAEKLAVEYYKSDLVNIRFGGTSPEKAAIILAAQGSKTSLKKDILSIQKKLAKNQKR